MKKIFKSKIREWNIYNAPFVVAKYKQVKGIWSWFIGTKKVEFKKKTIRRVIRKNLSIWEFRRELLKKLLKKKRVDLRTKFWWAKYWRRGKALRKLIEELKGMDNLPNYTITNKERYERIKEALDKSEEHFRNFNFFFMDVPDDFGYQKENFTEFMKDREEDVTYTPITNKYMQYFK